MRHLRWTHILALLPIDEQVLWNFETEIYKIDRLLKSIFSVIPDLIRNPETI